MGMRWAQVVVKLNTVTKFLFQQQLTLFLEDEIIGREMNLLCVIHDIVIAYVENFY